MIDKAGSLEIKRLEERVELLAEAFIEESLGSRTKRFKTIEKYYIEHPDSEKIAEQYILCYSTLDELYDNQAAYLEYQNVLAGLLRKFPRNECIIDAYVDVLVEKSCYCEVEEGISILTEVKRLAEIEKGVDISSDFDEKIEQIVTNVKNAERYKNLKIRISDLEKEGISYDNEIIFSQYIKLLSEACSLTDYDECKSIYVKVSAYENECRNNNAYVLSYAKVIYNLILRCEIAEQDELIAKLDNLFAMNTSEEVALIYVDALYEIAWEQERIVNSALSKLRRIQKVYPQLNECKVLTICLLRLKAEKLQKGKRIAMIESIFRLAEECASDEMVAAQIDGLVSGYEYDFGEKFLDHYSEYKNQENEVIVERLGEIISLLINVSDVGYNSGLLGAQINLCTGSYRDFLLKKLELSQVQKAFAENLSCVETIFFDAYRRGGDSFTEILRDTNDWIYNQLNNILLEEYRNKKLENIQVDAIDREWEAIRSMLSQKYNGVMQPDMFLKILENTWKNRVVDFLRSEINRQARDSAEEQINILLDNREMIKRMNYDDFVQTVWDRLSTRDKSLVSVAELREWNGLFRHFKRKQS